MFPLATALDTLKKLPPSTWLKLAAIIASFVVGVIVLRKIAHMNKLVLSGIVFLVVVLLGFNWVYERNEPAFLTPLVEKVAPFFPSKGSYGKQSGGGQKM